MTDMIIDFAPRNARRINIESDGISMQMLNHMFSYCRNTGVITRKIRMGRYSSGTRAGSVTQYGTRTIRINGRSYSEASVAYALAYGVWPEREPIHLNDNGLDNSADNLSIPGVVQTTTTLAMLVKYGKVWCKEFAHIVVIEDNGCIEFVGNKDAHGYGRFHNVLAHRRSLLLSGVDISGKCVLHKCDNPPCVNPDHLFVGTQIDNIADAKAKGRIPSGSKHWTQRAKFK